MGTLVEAVVAADSTFKTHKSKKRHRCPICTSNTRTKILKDYTENPVHFTTVQELGLVFEIRGAKVSCKVCSSAVDWDTLKTQASWHRTVPWHEPEDRCKTFLENHVLKWGKQFYCYPCKRIFATWFTAFVHIAEERHQKLITAELPENKSLPLPSKKVTYQLLVNNAVVAWNNNVRCRICDCANFGCQNIVPHINGSRHKNAKSMFETELKKRMNNGVFAEKGAECSKAKKSTSERVNSPKAIDQKVASKSAGTIPLCNYVKKRKKDGTDAYCVICDISIRNRTIVEDHVRGEMHRRALAQYGCDKISRKKKRGYYCAYCCCDFPGRAGVYSHVKGKTHMGSLCKFSNNKITVKEDRKYYCGYCECDIPDFEIVSRHIDSDSHERSRTASKTGSTEQVRTSTAILVEGESTKHSEDISGKRHTRALQQWSDNKITLTNGNDCYCGYCKCVVLGLDNVSQHIHGNRHTRSQTVMRDASGEREVSGTNERSGKAKPVHQQHVCNSTCETLPCRYFEKHDNGDFYCRICCCKFIDIEFSDHVTAKRHATSLKRLYDNNISYKEGNGYYCDYCECTVPGLGNVSPHINGKRHHLSRSKMENRSDQPALPAIKKMSVEAKLVQQPHACNSTYQTLPYMYFKKYDNGESYCTICACILTENNFNDHATGKRHASSVRKFNDNKISLIEDNDYYCGYCKCRVPGFNNISVHIQGNRHKSSQSKINDVPSEPEVPTRNTIPVKVEPKASPITKIPVKVETDLPTSNKTAVKVKPTKQRTNSAKDVCYILKLAGTCSVCKICDVDLYGQTTIGDHLAGKSHATAFKKYGCANISLKEDNNYYCRCCECRIPGLGNVYLHVKGNRHTSSLTVSNKAKTPKPLARDSIISSLTTKLTRLTVKAKPALPQKGKKWPRFKQLFGDRKENAFHKETCCTICNDTVKGEVTLHTHLARHFSADFICPSKKTDDKIINSSVKDQTERNEITESQTKLNSNGRMVNTGLAMDGEKSFAKREDKITDMKKIVQLLDFDKDYIYSLKDKLTDIELGMKLCFPAGSKNIYCLICQKLIPNVAQNYFDHLYSLDHCVYLDQMEKDDGLFDAFPGQFSALDLALEYMEEMADDTVRCLACERQLDNIDRTLQEHIDGKKHGKKSKEMTVKAKENFELVKSRVRCNWYQVQRYWCVLCLMSFRSEVNFVKHVEDHALVTTRTANGKKKMIFDFCEPCALLWYGYRCTHANHCDIPMHRWLVRDGHYVSTELPESVKILLATPEKYIERKIKYYDEVSVKEREKERKLIRDIEKSVKSKFPHGKAHVFGSRVSGLGSPESDIDVFLDCGNMYDGNTSSMDQMLKFMTDVHECLSKEPKSWDVDEVLTTCRSPIIKAHHRVTGLSCDISFENGLAVENTKLIKSFNDIYPSCRKMILFLKQWLALSDLSGSQAISSYALCWYVIFYLQKESILPSIAKLIAMKNKSHLITGWQVGVENNFSYNPAESSFSVEELLIRFFTFYANFNFRYEVACPLIGGAVKKREFADPENLPKEMATYSAYIKKSASPEPFRIDSVMCIQDPFDLQHNITKAVSKVYLSRFRSYCSKSLDILSSSEM